MSNRKSILLTFGVCFIFIVSVICIIFILKPDAKAEETIYNGDGVSITYDNSYGEIINVATETSSSGGIYNRHYVIINNIEIELNESCIWIQDELDITIYGFMDIENNYKFVRNGNQWIAENPSSIMIWEGPMNGDESLACYFTFPLADLVQEHTSFNLIFNANGGNLTINSMEVTNGETIGSLPTPTMEGYRFDGWYIGDTLINENTIWNYATDQTAIAKWVKQYIVNIQADNSGYGTITNTIQGNYDEGSTITSIAISNDGYYFKNWQDAQGNIITTSNQLEIIVSNDINYIATFTTNLAQGVNVTSTYGGKVSLVGDNFENLVDEDTIIFVAMVAQQGYEFSHWEDINGNILGYTESIMLKKENVFNNIIKAVFIPINNNNVNTSIDNLN